jgi:hypothetical protein
MHSLQPSNYDCVVNFAVISALHRRLTAGITIFLTEVSKHPGFYDAFTHVTESFLKNFLDCSPVEKLMSSVALVSLSPMASLRVFSQFDQVGVLPTFECWSFQMLPSVCRKAALCLHAISG